MYKNEIKELKENGVVVIKIPSKKLTIYRDQFLKDKHAEFTRRPDEFVFGPSGELGHPTSFHHPSIRKLRMKIHEKLKKFWKPIIDEEDKFIELLFDRFAICRSGTRLPNESWHRDIYHKKIDKDYIYSGWVNLDNEGSDDQLFSCILSSHNHIKMNNKSKLIRIPPGHIIIYSQNMVHEAISKEYKATSYKLHIGWRTTEHLEPLFEENVTTAIENQGLIKIPCGQVPSIYGSNHRRLCSDRLLEFSKSVTPSYRDERGYVLRYLPSLKEMNQKLLPPYKKRDINILVPHRL